MYDSKTSELLRMGKRRFLKTLAGFGVSGTTLNWITKDALAEQTSDLEKEIPYIKAFHRKGPENEKPIYGTISREKWIKLEAAMAASNSLSTSLSKKIDTSNIVVGVRQRGRDPEIIVSYCTQRKTVPTDSGTKVVTTTPNISKETLENSVPTTRTGVVQTSAFSESVSNIPVVVEEESRIDTYDAKFDAEYSPVPGGAQFDHGTLGVRAQCDDCDGYWAMLASGHALKDAQFNSDDLQQPKNGRVIGSHDSIEFWREDANENSYDDDITDFGYFEPNSDVELTDKLALDPSGYKSIPVAGIVSWDWVKNNQFSNTVYKQGEHTGITQGEIVKVENDYGQKVFWSQANGKSGDSGGPHYTFIDGDRYFVGINSWGVDVGSTSSDDGIRTGGNCAEKIEDKANLFVY